MTDNTRQAAEKAGGYVKREMPFLDPETLEDYMELRGIRIYYNVVSKRMMIDGLPCENREFLDDNLPTMLFSELQGHFRGCTLELITGYLNIIMSRHTINPIVERLTFETPDGTDHIAKVYDILGLGEGDELSRTLVKKWLMQCIAMQRNSIDEPFGADGVLCLTGPQGIGKTSFFRRLSMYPEYFKEGVAIDFRDKDTYIRALGGWICELGEVESTLRRDIEKLKAFITQSVDEYRKPYGRSDIRCARHTSLCATCNSSEYLIDITGNRRFWTVPVKRIDLKALSELDVPKLWAQVQKELGEDSQSFRLSTDEQRALIERNRPHEKPLPAQSEITDILSDTGGASYRVLEKLMTVSEFKQQNEILRPYSVQQIATALTRLGIESVIIRENNKTRRVRKLPYRLYDKYNYNK